MPHIHDKIDFTAEVFVVHKDKVLLRKHDKYKIWLSVGGHIELNEDPNEAAIREVKEEVGLDVKLIGQNTRIEPLPKSYCELIPPAFLNRHKVSETHEHVTLTYFATSDTDKLKLSEHEVTDGCKWFTLKQLEEDSEITARIKFYAKKALEAAASTK